MIGLAQKSEAERVTNLQSGNCADKELKAVSVLLCLLLKGRIMRWHISCSKIHVLPRAPICCV